MQGIDSYLCVAPVKNRYGKADPTGATYITLSFDPAKMHLEDTIKDHLQQEMMVLVAQPKPKVREPNEM